MHKFFIILLCSFMFLITQTDQVLAYEREEEYKGITKNQKIIEALNALKETEAKWVLDTVRGDNVSKRPIRIMFRKLEKMNPSYRTYEALTCIDSSDKIYVFINSKHKDAPVEAIAALLTHEVLHQDDENSIAEETHAWTNEAVNWMAFIKANPSLSENPSKLVKRLNKLAAIYKNSGIDGINKKVMSIPAYKTLEMASAGFDY